MCMHQYAYVLNKQVSIFTNMLKYMHTLNCYINTMNKKQIIIAYVFYHQEEWQLHMQNLHYKGNISRVKNDSDTF